MKKIIAIFALMYASVAFSQVIMGDAIGTATQKDNVLLEFSTTENKGVILPYVRTISSTPSEGTILLDASTPTAAEIKYYNGSSWVSLTNAGVSGDVSTELTKQPTTTEDTKSMVIIGSDTTSADGVMVLESTEKVMLLPRVNSVADIVNPSPGMMVFLTEIKKLGLYNGNKWHIISLIGKE